MLRILYLEDEPTDAELVGATLNAAGISADITRVETSEDFARALENSSFDLIFSDNNLPTFTGPRALDVARAKAPDTPFIFVSGTLGEEVAIESLKNGAVDYVLKHRLARLVPVTQRALREAQEHRERKQAEEHIQYQANLLKNVSDAIISTDRNFIIESWNNGAEVMYGWKAEELIGKESVSILNTRYASDTEENSFQTLMAEGTWQGEVTQQRKDGTFITVHASVSLLTDTAGNSIGAVTVNRDITERKLAEEARLAREAADEANKAKSEFLSRMSHELRTPMNSILGFGQLLEMDQLTPMQSDSVGFILKAGHHLLDLINEVLEISRIEVGRLSISPDPVDLDALLTESFDLVKISASHRSINLRIEIGDKLYVWADSQKLQQVLLNMLSNAIKYNREGGSVTIRYERRDNDMIRIEITDSGQGIPAEKQHRLFAPFDRLGAEETTVPGTGLGLTVSKQLMEAMGGQIGVESTVGKGSTFWIQLPETSPHSDQGDSEQSRIPVLSEPEDVALNILYIEDTLANMALIEKILARWPRIHLIPAMKGRLGIELAHQHLPDVILLDLHLPDIQGDDVLQELKAASDTADIPIVIVSADANQSQVTRLLEAGATAYITKPLDVQQFLLTIQDIARARGKTHRN